MDRQDPPAPRPLPRLAMVGFVLAGATLRLFDLRDQILGGDELHAVRAVATRPVSEILTRYSLVDYSLPVAAFHRLLLDLGVTLSEMDFRLPSLLAGLLALVLLPRAASGRVERFPAELFGWLVAFSPALVLYSRIARSYMPMILLSFLAVMAFYRWWHGGARRDGVAYVLLGALAVWVHLGAGPIVAAPFLFAAGDVVRARAWRRLRALFALGLGLLLAMAAYLVPAGRSLLRLVGNKHQEIEIPLRTVGSVLRLQAGTPSWTLTALFWGAALAGLVVLIRSHPRLGWFTLTVSAGHVAGLLALSPVGIHLPLVLNRYLLPVLPFVLLWIATALGRRWIPRTGLLGQGLQRSASRFFILFLFWTGPFLMSGYRTSDFLHHNDFVSFDDGLSSIPAEVVSAVYRELPRGPVLEYPWSTVWEQNRTFYLYQQVHGRRVMVSAPADIPRSELRERRERRESRGGIDLRNEVAPEPEAFLASPARTLVVHVRLPWEEDRVSIPGRIITRPYPPRLRRYYRRAGERMAARLEAAWGPPDAADRLVRVWDLERVRRERR